MLKGVSAIHLGVSDKLALEQGTAGYLYTSMLSMLCALLYRL